MSETGEPGQLQEQIEADREPGPTTDEVVTVARRAVEEAWAEVSRLVGPSWKKPHAAALVQRREAQRPVGKVTAAMMWQADLVEHLLAGLSAANREREGAWARSQPAKKLGLKCSFCGKSDHEIERLIGGPGVTVCNECVELFVWVLAQPGRPS